MKQFFFVALVLCVLAQALLNCKKSDLDPPVQVDSSCKLLFLERLNGHKYTFTYNDLGLVASMAIDVPKRDGSALRDTYVYAFSYSGNKQLSGATITVNGKAPTQVTDRGIGDAVSFTWTNGKLTQIIDKITNKPFLTTTLTYDAQGRITAIHADADPTLSSSFETLFSYDEQGNFRISEPDGNGGLYYEDVTLDHTTKNAESLLSAQGLPYNMFYSLPWLSNAYSSIKGYEVDPSGQAVLVTEYKRISVVKNSRNIATSQTIENKGTQRTIIATLADCD